MRSGTETVSAVAKATWTARAARDGAYLLDLVVVWRGSPGWFANSDTGSGGSGGGGTGAYTAALSYGDVNLHVSLTYEPRALMIQGKPVPLGDENVVLVDRVDTAGPVIVRTLRVDPSMGSGRGSETIYEVLARAPDVVEFLQCSTRLAHDRLQAVVDRICARITGN
jgi:hypothetical protein